MPIIASSAAAATVAFTLVASIPAPHVGNVFPEPCDSAQTQSLAIRAIGEAMGVAARSGTEKEKRRTEEFVEAVKKGGVDFKPFGQWIEGTKIPGTEIGNFRVCIYLATLPDGSTRRFEATIYANREAEELKAIADVK